MDAFSFLWCMSTSFIFIRPSIGLLQVAMILPVITTAQSIDLIRQHQWQQRVLLVFSTHTSNEQYQRQLAEYQQQQEGFQERDLVVYKVLADQVIAPTGEVYPQTVAQALRDQYGVSQSEWTVVLVGKDGQEKVTKRGMFNADQLFIIIDQMPMRRRERQH